LPGATTSIPVCGFSLVGIGAACRLAGAVGATRVIMEIIRVGEAATFSNSGIISHQLLFPENSRSKRVTVTRVTVAPGASNPPHRHASSEQIWIALRGNGRILLDDDRKVPFSAGDVVRFEDNEFHGFENPGSTEFEYLSITSPPINFRDAYARMWSDHSES
jgi:quercetin dioxygenase-like cupin family protein